MANSGNTIYGFGIIGTLRTNFSEILIKIQKFSLTKMRLKTFSAKRWPFCPGGDELTARNAEGGEGEAVTMAAITMTS